jgi:uncharacterized membrane protein
MKMSETDESRVRGYLYVLERSLRTFLPRDVVDDAVREVESHIRERLEQTETPDGRAALERILGELGPPLQVARAYSTEMAVEEAIATGRVVAVARALWHIAASTVGGFLLALALFIGYTMGAAFAVIAMLKPVFPDNVGLFVAEGRVRSFGAQFPAPEGATVVGGYWIIPLALLAGLALLVGTHRIARWRLVRWRAGRRPLVADGRQSGAA